MSPRAPDHRISVGKAPRGQPDLQGLILLESLFATEWYDSVVNEMDGDAAELLGAIGRDSSDHAEELRRVLMLWERAGGEDGARRVRRVVRDEMLALVREERRRSSEILLEASERAPTAEIAERLRQLAREARGHAERLEEIL